MGRELLLLLLSKRSRAFRPLLIASALELTGESSTEILQYRVKPNYMLVCC